MANRRMFSKRVISSARFMKLTKDAQVLYFHLCLNADDDGAVEGFPVRRSIGIEEDAYANLEGRGFITVLDRENEVLYINDWNEHNKIRADRIQTSVYRELIQRIVGDVALIEPKQRSDIKGSRGAIDIPAGNEPVGRSTDGQSAVHGQATDGLRTDNGRSTDGPRTGHGQAMDGLGEVRLGQVRSGQESLELGEESKGKKKRTAKPFTPPSYEECASYYQEKGFSFDLDFFYKYFTEMDWHDSTGKKVQRWKGKMLTWQNQYNEHHKPEAKNTGFMQHTESEKADNWGWE